jgi:hypothetical protein
MTLFYKTIRLCYVDFLFQLSIEESYLNIHLMDEKTMQGNQGE